MTDTEEGDLRDDDDGIDGVDLTEGAPVFCPYCGESVDVLVDLAGGAVQEYVEDCEVCCRPWAVRVVFDAEGRPTITATTLEDG